MTVASGFSHKRPASIRIHMHTSRELTSITWAEVGKKITPLEQSARYYVLVVLNNFHSAKRSQWLQVAVRGQATTSEVRDQRSLSKELRSLGARKGARPARYWPGHD